MQLSCSINHIIAFDNEMPLVNAPVFGIFLRISPFC